MLAGADSIDDMAVLRHGGMGRVFSSAYAPSRLGSFVPAFTFGHVRQLDAVAARSLLALAGVTPLVSSPATSATSATDLIGKDRRVLGRMDDAFFGAPRDPGRAGRWCGRVGRGPVDRHDQGRDRWDRRGRVENDRVHGRGSRRGHRGVDLPARGRRDPVHRAQVRAPRLGPARRAPHPRLQCQKEEGRRARHPDRRVAPSTHSSPPPTPTSSAPWPPTRRAGTTRSSNKSTPT